MTLQISQTSNYILSIIATNDSALHSEAITKVIEWCEAQNIRPSERKRTHNVFVAGICLCGDYEQQFLDSLKTSKPFWQDTFQCNVNCCSAKVCDWWMSEDSKEKCLFMFDLDSTLIQMETIDEMARLAGKYDQVAGRISFVEAFKQRVQLLKGLEAAKTWDDITKRIAFTVGCRDLATEITERGCHSAIVSGGFMPIVDYVRKTLSFDHCKANEIEVVNGRFTGEINGEIIVAVGDGANDIPMLNTAAYGIAFNAKPIVQSQFWIFLESIGRPLNPKYSNLPATEEGSDASNDPHQYGTRVQDGGEIGMGSVGSLARELVVGSGRHTDGSLTIGFRSDDDTPIRNNSHSKWKTNVRV
ncbi:Phosphoserine phosphatase SerB [Paramicrosporidium saccamoebae]|uniref:phosphoserine phosphatase n=1 Tax=Paramicrosporidium saccamoebae TaxID=1246581 RepID=A0A2H9TKW7_9FUNG|nr:Phosphoserine phosphatase SerB [Paramicrosporidium saccamoebae]